MPVRCSARLRHKLIDGLLCQPCNKSFSITTTRPFTQHPKFSSRIINSLLPPAKTRFIRATGVSTSFCRMNGTNGTTRAKRKQPPMSSTDRPQKQHRALNGKESAGQNTPEITSMYEEDESSMELEEPRIIPGLADTAEWQAAIEKVVRNVVSIRFCQTCSFDTDPALTSEATGFVVDAERGSICSFFRGHSILIVLQLYHDQSTCRGIGTLLGILHIRQSRRS